jgi:hypothetical protein
MSAFIASPVPPPTPTHRQHVSTLKLSQPHDPTISQSSQKPPKFSGLTAIAILNRNKSPASTVSSEAVLAALVDCEFLTLSSGTKAGASPVKDKVHYRFNDKAILAYQRKLNPIDITGGGSQLRKQSFTVTGGSVDHRGPSATMATVPVVTHTTTRVLSKDGRSRETFLKRFVITFTAMYLLIALEVHYDFLSRIGRFFLISFLTLMTVLLTERTSVESVTEVVTAPAIGSSSSSSSSSSFSSTSTSSGSLPSSAFSGTSIIYPVNPGEIQELRSTISHQYPAINSSLRATVSDTYLKSVLSQANSKKKSERRTVAYATEKICNYLAWREKTGVDALLTTKKADYSAEFAEGAVYWYGVDKCGRPILWERFDKMDWANFDVKRKLDFYVALFEAAFGVLPEDTTMFTVVAETSGIPYVRAITKPKFFLGMAGLFVTAFPDRLGAFLGKSNSAVQFVLRIIKPVMPASVSTKMVFPKDFNEHLVDLLGDEKKVPTWLGGPAVHEDSVTKDFDTMIRNIKQDMVRGARG